MPNALQINRDELLADVSSELETRFNQVRVSAMLHYMHETTLSDEQRAFAHEVFFGGEAERKSYENGFQIDSLFLERYAEYRTLGLSQAECALLLGITPQRLLSFFQGEGLSRQQHKFLLRAEALGDIQLKAETLQAVVDAIKANSKDSWRAAIAFMEKRWPDQYGKKVEMSGPIQVRMSAELCEDTAIKARAALEEIRAKRGESLGIPAEDLYVKPEDYAAGPDVRQIELGLTESVTQ